MSKLRKAGEVDMSVILTDMEMPSGCWCCEFGAVWNDESSLCKRKPMESPIGNYEGRPLWCPLKEQEPKTGKWILDDEDANSWECSECGGLLIINDGTPHEND